MGAGGGGRGRVLVRHSAAEKIKCAVVSSSGRRLSIVRTNPFFVQTTKAPRHQGEVDLGSFVAWWLTRFDVHHDRRGSVSTRASALLRDVTSLTSSLRESNSIFAAGISKRSAGILRKAAGDRKRSAGILSLAAGDSKRAAGILCFAAGKFRVEGDKTELEGGKSGFAAGKLGFEGGNFRLHAGKS